MSLFLLLSSSSSSILRPTTANQKRGIIRQCKRSSNKRNNLNNVNSSSSVNNKMMMIGSKQYYYCSNCDYYSNNATAISATNDNIKRFYTTKNDNDTNNSSKSNRNLKPIKSNNSNVIVTTTTTDSSSSSDSTDLDNKRSQITIKTIQKETASDIKKDNKRNANPIYNIDTNDNNKQTKKNHQKDDDDSKSWEEKLMGYYFIRRPKNDNQQHTDHKNTKNYKPRQQKKPSNSSYNPMNDIIYDSSLMKHVIYIPPQTIPSNNSNASTITTLPIIDASVLLDVKKYITIYSTISNTTKSGTDAAKRLLYGKQLLYNIIQSHHYYNNYNYYNSSERTTNDNLRRRQQQHSSYVLRGHGIPVQLLQNHINLADTILTKYSNDIATNNNSISTNQGIIQSCQFRISHPKNPKLDTSSASSNMYMNYDDWDIRLSKQQQPQHGIHKSEANSDKTSSKESDDDNFIAVPWLSTKNDETNNGDDNSIENDMELYVTVMNRITQSLSGILRHNNNIDHNYSRSNFPIYNNNSNMENKSSLCLSPLYWSIAFQRGLHYLPEQLPTSPTTQPSVQQHQEPHQEHFIYPVIEWIPNHSTKARLSRVPERNEDDHVSKNYTDSDDNATTGREDVAPFPDNMDGGGRVIVRIQGCPKTEIISSPKTSRQHLHQLDENNGVTLCFDAYFG